MRAVRKRERSFTLTEMLVAVGLSAGLYIMFTQVFSQAMKVINETGAYYNLYHQVAGAYTIMRENSEQHPIRWWDMSPGWYDPKSSTKALNERGEVVDLPPVPRSSSMSYFVWTNLKKNPDTLKLEPSTDLLNENADSPMIILHGLVKNYFGPSDRAHLRDGLSQPPSKSARLYDGRNKLPAGVGTKPPVGGIDQCYQLELYLVNEGQKPVPASPTRWFVFHFWIF